MSGHRPRFTTGIVVALTSEAAVLTAHKVRPGHPIPLDAHALLSVSGMGPRAAKQAALQLVDAGADMLAVFGVAGALDANLRGGTLLCPEHVVDEHDRIYATDTAWRTRLHDVLASAQIPLQTAGSLLSVDTPLLTPLAKHDAHQRHHALAVDMESAAVAAVAEERGFPLLVLRAIVDEASDTIPAALNGSVDAWGRPIASRLIAALCRHPGLWADLPRLYSRMQRATQSLRIAVKAAGPGLGAPTSPL